METLEIFTFILGLLGLSTLLGCGLVKLIDLWLEFCEFMKHF